MQRSRINFFLIAVIVISFLSAAPAQKLNTNTAAASPVKLTLPLKEGSLHFAVIGDTGSGTQKQRDVGEMMVKYRAAFPFDFVLMMGDNLYGGETPRDFETKFSEPYKKLLDDNVKFYATLGNHDWGFADSPAAEILYTQQSPSWRMPAPYYTFTAGPVQFFALDTNEVSEAQLLWLKDELAKSGARWKLVYGHHPIYSAGVHGDSPTLIKRLLPVLKGRADVFLAGHDHDLQHLKAEDGVHFFVAGGGGAGIRTPKAGPRSLFAKDAYAFCVLEADGKQLKVRFIDTALNQLYEATLTKSGAAAVLEATQ